MARESLKPSSRMRARIRVKPKIALRANVDLKPSGTMRAMGRLKPTSRVRAMERLKPRYSMRKFKGGDGPAQSERRNHGRSKAKNGGGKGVKMDDSVVTRNYDFWLTGWKSLARYVDYSTKTCKRMVRDGLPRHSCPSSGRPMFKASEVDRWLKKPKGSI